jgi:hypothetical protein
MKLIDMTGLTFGLLTVVGRAPTKSTRTRWICQCECGGTTVAHGGSLRQGLSRSCGCARNENLRTVSITHGLTYTAEHRTWKSMKDRCCNPSNKNYPNWGGRGISICSRWMSSFAAFYQDVGPKPGPEYSIDRIDNDGNYEPGNVRWATPREQRLNQRPRVRGGR